MIEYPPIPHLLEYDLNGKYGHELSRAEFEMVAIWLSSEKLDGLHTRVVWDGSNVQYLKRKGVEPLSDRLIDVLKEHMPADRLSSAFGMQKTVIFGEFVGPGIKGSDNYAPDPRLFAFDIWQSKRSNWEVGKYLPLEEFDEALKAIRLPSVPKSDQYVMIQSLVDKVIQGFQSPLATRLTGKSQKVEGVVGRCHPDLYDAHGNRLMWQLKSSDFGRIQPAGPQLIIPGRGS